MDENDFKDLLNEIDSMDIEEYNKYHEKALEMKKSYDDNFQQFKREESIDT